MPSKSVRGGFTLVELLVVIAIIGTMIALLLPAVQAARESSRRSTCLSNIRQIAIAALEFEERHRRYPGVLEDMPIQQRKAESGERFTTWAVVLLPDMDRQSAYDEYAKGELPLPEIYVEAYLCPSDAEKQRAGSVTTYAANAGRAASAKFQRPANGPFLNRVYDPKAAMMEGHWKDGREYTLAFSERTDLLGYHIMGWAGLVSNPNNPSADYIDRDYVDESGYDRLWGPVFVWHSTESEDANCPGDPCFELPKNGSGRYVAKDCIPGCNVVRSRSAKPSSEHNGGVNVAFGGGRALFLKETIDPDVLRALMTSNEKKSDSPNPDLLIDDSSLL